MERHSRPLMRLWVLAAAGCLFYPAVLTAQGIVIDHTCVNLAAIPSNWVADVRDHRKVHYAHTSHGSQIDTGLELIETVVYSVEIGYRELPAVSGALCIFDGQEGEDYITPDLYWQTPQGLQNTRDVLNHNPSINASMWAWCTQLDYYTAPEVQQYLSAMSQLESEYPSVRFVYFTGNAQATDADGYNRHLRNEQIRQYCRDHGKVLFDFGELDSWWYNPAAAAWEQATYSYGGQQIPVEHPQFHGDNGGHTNDANCQQKARAYWWLLARLQGWGGPNACAAAPGSLALAPAPGSHTITLSWQDRSGNEDSFLVQRQVDGGAWNTNYHSVAANVTSWADTGLADGTYAYRVAAHRNNDGTGSPCNSDPSNTASATLNSAPPAAPSGLTAARGTNGVNLAWQDNSSNEDHFGIERSADGGGFLPLAETDAGVSQYADTSAGTGHRYGYRVRATNAFGASAWSETAEIAYFAMGDINGDGRTDVVDLLIMLHAAAGQLAPGTSPCDCPGCGDWNGSGALDAQDAGLCQSLLAENEWAGETFCPGHRPDFVTDTLVRQAPALAEPVPGSPLTEPVFDTCLVRVTDRVNDKEPDDPSAGLHIEYSRVNYFNADGSRLLVRGTAGTWYLYDGATLAHLGQLVYDGVDPRWDASDPDRFYFFDWSARLIRHDITTGDETMIYDFAPLFPGPDPVVVWTRNEGNASRDQRYWGLAAENQSAWDAVAFLVYDRQANQVIARRNFSPARDITSVSMSPLGNYFVAWFAEDCGDTPGSDASPCGIMVYDRNLANGRPLFRGSWPSDLALDTQGREVLVAQDYDAGFIVMVDLATGAQTNLVAIPATTEWVDYHFCGHSWSRPGWVVAAGSDNSASSETWPDDQVFLVELKAGGRVVRLAHTRSVVDPAQEEYYYAYPMASADAGLTRIVFTSNWGRTGTSTNRTDVYLIELPVNWPSQLP